VPHSTRQAVAITELEAVVEDLREIVALVEKRYTSFPEVGAALTNMLKDSDPTVRNQAERLLERNAGGTEK
jgi:hypothetical protein